MSIPDQPYTRDEMYLNAIATGDSSGVPATPYTRQEMYLDAIAKGGGGSSGGGVFFVHAEDNEAGTAVVLDKTWQEIKDASATSVVVLSMGTDFAYLYVCSHVTLGGEKWRVGFFSIGESYLFETTEGANAHPEMQYE